MCCKLIVFPSQLMNILNWSASQRFISSMPAPLNSPFSRSRVIRIASTLLACWLDRFLQIDCFSLIWSSSSSNLCRYLCEIGLANVSIAQKNKRLVAYSLNSFRNSVGVSRSRSLSSSILSVNQANLSPSKLDLIACPSLSLPRLLKLPKRATLKCDSMCLSASYCSYRLAFLANAFVLRLLGCLSLEMSCSKLVGACKKAEIKKVFWFLNLNNKIAYHFNCAQCSSCFQSYLPVSDIWHRAKWMRSKGIRNTTADRRNELCACSSAVSIFVIRLCCTNYQYQISLAMTFAN